MCGAIAVSACTRYEYKAVNEFDVPGACPKDTPAVAAAVADTTLADVVDSVRGLTGVVVHRGTGAALTTAIVHVLGTDTVRLALDTLGRFRLPQAMPGAFVRLDVRSIGYARVVATIRVPAVPAGAVRIALTPATLDGPCSGFSMLLERRRKPWWKLW